MNVEQSIFKTYDIRGIVGETLTVDVATAIGQAFATFLQPRRVVCGRDVRVSGPDLQGALINGLRKMGVDVVDIGVVTSDGLYFAVAKYGFDGGAMVTASHNPPQWNGIKFVRDQAKPVVGEENQQLFRIVRDDAYKAVTDHEGSYATQDIHADFVQQVLSFSKLTGGRPLKVVIDPGNGTAAPFIPDIMNKLPYTWQGINMIPDGTFPGRDPNPIAPGATDGLKAAILAAKADVGVAFDADADRMFLVDERGERVFGDALTALLAKQFLVTAPGSAIVYNLICSHMVPEEITKSGGRPIRSAVGLAHMKPAMRENNAVFGGEISGHFFFRDHYFVDSGLVAMVVALEYLSHQQQPLSTLVKDIDIYAHTAEVNTRVADIPAAIARVKAKFSDGQQDELDGLTVEYADWWFNVRPSNTEPLLRLSVEAATMPEMEKHRDEILATISQ